MSKNIYFLVVSILFLILISLLHNFTLLIILELMCIFIGNYYYKLNSKDLCILSLILDIAHLNPPGYRAIPIMCGFAFSDRLSFGSAARVNFYTKFIAFIATSYFISQLLIRF